MPYPPVNHQFYIDNAATLKLSRILSKCEFLESMLDVVESVSTNNKTEIYSSFYDNDDDDCCNYEDFNADDDYGDYGDYGYYDADDDYDYNNNS